MSERSRLIRRRALHDPTPDPDYWQLTPAERMSPVWQSTLETYSFMGEDVLKTPLRRNIVRVRSLHDAEAAESEE